MTAPLRARSEPIVVQVALGTRAYDIVIGRGLLASLGARIKALRAGRQDRDRHRRDRGQAPSRSDRGRAQIRRHRELGDRGAARRGLQELRDVRDRVRGDHRGAHRARRSRRRARRRRDRRSCRLCGGQRAARARFRAGADDAAGAGRFLGRRQDRHQFPPWQESGRRLPSADPGDRRHRAARHACRSANSAPAMPRSPNSGCSATPRSSPGWRPTGRTCFPAGNPPGALRASTPSRSAAAARPASSRATSARPASARCSISATPSATRWKRAPASPTGCCMARRWRWARRWRSSSPPARG